MARRPRGGARRRRGAHRQWADPQRNVVRQRAESDGGELFARIALHVQRVGSTRGVRIGRRIRRIVRPVRLGRQRTRSALEGGGHRLEVRLGSGDLARQTARLRYARRASAQSRRKGAHGRPLSRKTSVAARADGHGSAFAQSAARAAAARMASRDPCRHRRRRTSAGMGKGDRSRAVSRCDLCARTDANARQDAARGAR